MTSSSASGVVHPLAAPAVRAAEPERTSDVAAWEIDLDDCYQRALWRNGSPSRRARRFFLHRLRHMSARELAHRVAYALRRRRAAARLRARQAEVAATLRQPGARRVVGLVALDTLAALARDLRAAATDEEIRRYGAEADRIRAGERLVFGAPSRLPLPIAFGRDPATGYDWPAAPEPELAIPHDVDVKGVWELGKLAEPARLAWLGRALDRPDDVRTATDEALRFLAEHPIGLGPHWLSPLEVSIRLVSLLWILTCRDAERGDASPETAALVDAAAAHLDFLYDERSIFRDPNNHVIGEAVGLLLGGLALPGLPAAATYVDEGMRILAHELPRQLDDAGYAREASTDYHREVVEWLLQAALALRRMAPTRQNVPDQHLGRALCTSSLLAGATGQLPFFGDTDHARIFALGPAPTSDGRIFRLYHAYSQPGAPAVADADDPLLALTLLAMGGAVAPATPAVPASGLTAGGVDRASDPAGIDVYLKTGGAGLLPHRGHAHADLLAIQVMRAGVPRITDAGTHRYGTSASRRYVLRSARHHATLYLPPDQADPLDLFKWGTHPIAGASHRASAEGVDVLAGSHDGYARSRPGAIHRREVARIDGGCVLVIDRVGGDGETLVVFPYPLGPEARNLTPTPLAAAGGRVTYDDGTVVTIASTHPDLRRIQRRGGPHGSHSPRYGDLLPVHALELAGRVALPLQVVTLLHVAAPGAAEPREMRVDRSGRRVHIGIGRDDEPPAMQRGIEYIQEPDGARLVRISEPGGTVIERTLHLPGEWDAE